MGRLILSRLIQFPLILVVIFIITFTLSWIVPGNPLEQEDNGKRLPKEIKEAMLKQYNLDDPWKFAAEYLKGVFLHGDFGPSLSDRDQRVSTIMAKGLPVSMELGVFGLIVALLIGMTAGIAGALRPGTALDMSSLAVALLGISLPTFITGSILLAVLGGLLRWFPIQGWGTPWHIEFLNLKMDIPDLGYLVLPGITLGLGPAAYIARLIRLGLADVMGSDFVRTAKAKGVAPGNILFHHALKVAFLPVLSFLGPAAAAALTGSFVVEKVFSIPGIGRYFVNAVTNKDQFLILGIVLVYSTILILFNLIVDIAYAWVDPRIELS